MILVSAVCWPAGHKKYYLFCTLGWEEQCLEKDKFPGLKDKN
jgi:hypothetical protein